MADVASHRARRELIRRLLRTHLVSTQEELGELLKREGIDVTQATFARVVGRYCDVVMMRTFGDERIRELAKHCEVPVINGLTDGGHPVQILTDLLTIEERLGRLKGTTIAFVGDTGSNMGRSFTEGASLFGYTLKLASPPGYHPADDVVRLSKDQVQLLSDPRAAVEGADAVVTDVWTSMGQEARS